MSSRSSSSNSFSFFSDLKDLQAQLRRQNADLAQAKADAIIVKDGQESTNKLKQKAASLAKFTSAAENALKAKALEAKSANHSVLAASDNDNARGTNAHTQKQDRRDRLQRADRAERSNEGNRPEQSERINRNERGERTNHHEQGERRNRAERGECTNSAERGSNRRERNDGSKNRNRSNDRNKNETEQQRLDRSLNRLQRKAMDLNEHAQKDKNARLLTSLSAIVKIVRPPIKTKLSRDHAATMKSAKIKIALVRSMSQRTSLSVMPSLQKKRKALKKLHF